MTPSRQAILLALQAQVESALSASFTADATLGSATLSNASTLTNLLAGWPVFALGVPADTVIDTITPPSTIVLSQKMTQAGTGVTFNTGFQTKGRRVLWHTQVPNQPALFVRQAAEHHPARPTGMGEKPIIDFELWIYARSGNIPDANPIDALNPLLDAVDIALKPSPVTRSQTLGGLVTHCWIEGDVVIDAGDAGPQAVAMIPVKVLVPQGVA